MRLIFEGPADGTALFHVVGPNPPATIEVRFDASSSIEQLAGLPTGWCNTPAVGQPLIFTVPVPTSGSSTSTLTVTPTTHPSSGPPVTGAGIRVPITVKHGV